MIGSEVRSTDRARQENGGVTSTRRIATLTVVCLAALGLSAHAQTTGSIRGQVAGPDGAVRPGATVVVAGEALIGGDLTAITGPNGTYRFAALRSGLYSVTATLNGCQTQRIEGVRVSINAAASVNFLLPEVFSEEVTVVAEVPLLDVTSSSVATSYDAGFIEDLPTARSMWDLMAVSPGISQTSEGSDRQVAFGSAMQSNAWRVDGLDTSSPETGSAWWYVNPDTISEVHVLGIGAPAEFGNMLGAAFNVVTKSGGNELHGGVNSYFQTDSLTGTNLSWEESEFPDYHREKFYDVTGTLGGPLERDRLWFFAAIEVWREGSTPAGADPAFAAIHYSDSYDLKITAAVNQSNRVEAKLHYEDWGSPVSGDAFTARSALGGEWGSNPAWGVSWQSIVSDSTVFEVKYAGWKGDDRNESQTGSTEPAYFDYSPPGGGPITYWGGVLWPWTYDTRRDQADVTLSHFADDLLGGDHDFKFGIQASRGDAITKAAVSATNTYYYHYTYNYDYYGTIYPYEYFVKVEGLPYFYGNDQESLSFFVDDSWSVNDRLTVSLGLRYDYHRGIIPVFPVLDGEGNPTGETNRAYDPAFTWKNWSPRLGFAYALGADQQTVIRGSFGVYFDGNVGGNWNFPPPGVPGLISTYNTEGFDAPFEDYWWEWHPGEFSVDPDLKAPRTLQYSLGFERELEGRWAVGVTAVYKETDDLIGWEILDDGVYDEVPYTDPFTGQQFTLWNEIEPATRRKGNRPGVTANPEATEYYQDYAALIMTFKKRTADGWSLMGSYTLSRSEGLSPRMLSAWQFNPFYGSGEGYDPNNYINADQLLQGDRRHMLNLQGNVDLPWGMNLAAMLTLQSGRPYSRQIRVPLNQGRVRVIMDPADDGRRHDFQTLLDVSLGKRFVIKGEAAVKIDLQLLNALNEDAVDYWQTLVLQEGDTFVPDYRFVTLPRRLMVRLAVEF